MLYSKAVIVAGFANTSELHAVLRKPRDSIVWIVEGYQRSDSDSAGINAAFWRNMIVGEGAPDTANVAVTFLSAFRKNVTGHLCGLTPY